MIENLDAEDAAGIGEALGELGVLAARSKITRRMIMKGDKSGSAAQNSSLEYLARMNERAVEASRWRRCASR